MSDIIQLLINTYQHWLEASDVGRPHLQAVLAHMEALDVPQPIVSHVPPVVKQYLAQAVELASPEVAPLAKRVLQMAPDLDWVILPDEYAGAEFAQNFAYVRLIGPPLSPSRPTMYPSQKICAGFSLQAPHIYYLPHRHKAIEFYGVLGGTALWQAGEEAWQPKPPGSFIYHPSELLHAMETQAEPLLTTYAWVGDIFSPLEAVRASS